jgi:hypothetical protein
LANGSTLNLAGAFLNVGIGSSFSLQGGSLVSFGFGTNTVNVTGVLASTCATCQLRTNIPGLLGIPVLVHPTSILNIEPTFVAFNGARSGTQTVGNQTVAFNNTVNLPGANRAALVVNQNATLTLRR